MGDVQRGDPQPLLEGAELIPHALAELGVQVGQGFVKQQHGRLDDYGAGQRHTLLLAAGELVGEPLLHALELHQLHYVIGATDDLILRDLGHTQTVGDVLPDVQVGEQGVGLEHHGDAPLVGGDLGYVPVSDEHVAAGGILKTGDHPQGGGLAAAGGAQQRHHLAVLDLKVDMVHSHEVLAGIGLLENFGHIFQNHAGALLAEAQLLILLLAHFDSSVFVLAWGTLERGASRKLMTVLNRPMNTSRMPTIMVTKAAA